MNVRAILLVLAFSLALAARPPIAGNSFAQTLRAEQVPSLSAPVAASEPTTQPATAPATQAATQTATTGPVPSTAPAEPAGANIQACHDQYMRGQYSSSAAGYKNLMAQDTLRVGAAVGAAQALAMEGKYSEAQEVLAKAGPAADKDANWHLCYAEVLTAVGEYDKALEHVLQADKLQGDYAPAIYAHGRLLEILGRTKEAVAVYRTIVKVIDLGQYRKDAPSLVALGQILDRDTVLSGKKASEQAGNILNNYFQEAYQKVDSKYWPANVAAGMFGLSKHRPDIASAEFTLAQRLNPRITDVFIGVAAAMLEQWDFEGCLARLKEALAINPRSADALVLKAQCLMQWRRFDEVAPVLDEALKVNPNHLDALSLYAALHIRQGNKDKAQPFIDRVHKINPTYADLPSAIGQWLSAGRQFEQAEAYFKQAIQLAPEQAEPLTNLGMMYMQTGEEAKAKEALTKANKIDDFRGDVINYLNLLDRLGKFQVKETDHFIIKVDGQLDAILLDQVATEAEKIYAEVCSDFDYHPAQKSVVEFFPTHQQFSVRITGKGWIGTVGASTGRVIAMVAPTPDVARSQFRTFNWSTVLRHEYTHTVTLAKTNNRIPHWFTEACAVWEQPDKRNYQATMALVMAYRARHLFPVKELDWGFIRPKQMGDRELAYAQAEWTMEYLIQSKGYPIIVKMLEGFRDGKTQKEVFEQIVGSSETDFDKAFLAWAKTQIEEQWRFDTSTTSDVAALAKEAKEKPKDATVLGKYALALNSVQNLPQAQKVAKDALELDPKNRDALTVMTAILAIQKKMDDAAAMAARLEEVDHKSKVAPRVLAEVFMEKRKWAPAIEALELYKQRAPMDEYSYNQLAQCYMNIGQPAKALPNLIELHEHAVTNPSYARRIADIYRSLDQENPAQKYDEQALRYYEQVTHINPYDSSAYLAMASIHLHAKRFAQAVQCAKSITLLAPDSAESWSTLAKVELRAGSAAKNLQMLKAAKTDAQKSMKMDASDQTKDLLDEIDEAIKSLQAPALP